MKKFLGAMLGREKAFTLVELLIVIAIIAILSVAFLPNVLNAPKKARDVVRVKNISDIAGALEVLLVEKGRLAGTDVSTGTWTDADNCFDAANAGAVGLDVVNFQDKKLNQDCGGSDKSLYYYRSATGSPYYIVGAKLETAASANLKSSKEGLNALTTAADIKAAIAAGVTSTTPSGGTATAGTEDWFVMWGPK